MISYYDEFRQAVHREQMNGLTQFIGVTESNESCCGAIRMGDKPVSRKRGRWMGEQ